MYRTRISSQEIEGEISSINFSNIVNGEIVYLQSQDVVRRGQGALYITEGGVEASNVTLWTLSGLGEPIDRTVEIFGFPTA